MQAVGGKEGDQRADDPVDREDSSVQAVACFCPPTDFLNFGQTGAISWETGPLKNFRAPFDFQDYRAGDNCFVKVTDQGRLQQLGRSISPIYHVTTKTPPVMLIHGDADELVPFQQSQLMAQVLNAAAVSHELIIKKGAGHAIATMPDDIQLFADWFDKILLSQSSEDVR
jgi:acetyl esterase/lipase